MEPQMAVVTQVLIGIIALMHVYFFVLESILFKGRGRRVFGITKENAEILAPAMSNQGCYNLFLAAALIIGLVHPDHDVARNFILYGLCCVAVAGLWGAATVKKVILFFQTVPAVLALIMFHIPA
jgi:putative membrane protein